MRMMPVVLLSFFVCFASLSSQGQGCVGIERVTIVCAGPNGCQDSVNVDRPQPGLEFNFFTTAVECCKELITDIILRPCPFSRVTMQQIARFLEASPAVFPRLLVASCDGRYTPFQPDNRPNVTATGFGYVNDHVLR